MREAGWQKIALGVAMAGVLAGCGTVPAARSASAGPSSSAPRSAASAPAATPSASSRQLVTPSPIAGTVAAMDFISPEMGWVAISPPNSAPGNQTAQLYRTTDGGRHWQRLVAWSSTNPLWHVSNGGPGDIVPVALSFLNAQNGWGLVPLGVGACQAQFGVVATTDGGQHWSSRGSLQTSDGPTSIAFATAQKGWLVNGSCAGAYSTAVSTQDGGAHWQQGPSLYPGKPNSPLAPTATDVGFPSPTQGFMVNAYWTYSPSVKTAAPSFQAYTLDTAGTGWSAATVGASGLQGRISRLSFDTLASGWAVINPGSQPELESTDNQGQAWQALSVGHGAKGFGPIDRVNQTVGYVVTTANRNRTGAILWKTQDGGKQWQAVPLP